MPRNSEAKIKKVDHNDDGRKAVDRRDTRASYRRAVSNRRSGKDCNFGLLEDPFAEMQVN